VAKLLASHTKLAAVKEEKAALELEVQKLQDEAGKLRRKIDSQAEELRISKVPGLIACYVIAVLACCAMLLLQAHQHQQALIAHLECRHHLAAEAHAERQLCLLSSVCSPCVL
jgi:ATP-dependent 26S proteasome regulatory subunit